MARKIAVGIDIGTDTIKVAVAENMRTENGEYISQIIGAGVSDSLGLRHGYVTNMNDALKSIQSAVSEAEKNSNIKIKSAYLAIGGTGLSALYGKGTTIISKADSEVTDLDIKNVMESAEEDLPKNSLLNRKIIYTIPLTYKIDDEIIMGRPKGMHGAKLEVKVLFITSIEQHLNDLIKAVQNAGLLVDGIMASPIAGSLINLSNNQRIVGCALVNIGAETTSIIVYENNLPISLEVFPIGSAHITNDIALGLRIPIDEAEKIKIWNQSEAAYSKKKVEEIVTHGLTTIFESVESHLKKIGRNGLLPAGIILTGNGSLHASSEDIARNSLKLSSKLASIYFFNVPKNDQRKELAFSVAYGLALWGLNGGDDSSLGIGEGNSANVFKPVIELFNSWFKKYLP